MPEEQRMQPESPEQVTLARRLVYFAAERTLMAWIRTSLGLMALGFVIDRFGLVLAHFVPIAGGAPHDRRFSFWAGTALVVVGAVMAAVAAFRYWRFARGYRRDRSTRPGHGIMVGVGFTVIIALLGFAVAAFLLGFTS